MTTALLIMAKAPVAGLAKTRLIPALGPDGAAKLARQLLNHTVGQALASGMGLVQLCVTPNTQHPAFQSLQQNSRGRLQLKLQCPGDLGKRMEHAMKAAMASHDRVMIIGTDAPGVTTPTLLQAERALNTYDAVFVPALDGGYALVGLRKPAAFLFENMAWSTATVMAETRDRLRKKGWHWHELEPTPDIDEPGDLRHVPESWLT